MAPCGLLFDFDNTLVNSTRAYDMALRAAGFAPTAEAYSRARREVKTRLGAGSTQAHHRLLYFKEMLPQASPSALLDAMHRYETALVAEVARQWQAMERWALFARWRERYPMIIVTNETARMQLLKWRACDPDGLLFTSLVSSEEVGHEKPHPAPFIVACERLGLAPQQCMMVGDNWDHDVAPALSLGMTAWCSREFTDSRAPVAQNAARCLPTLATLDRHLP